MYNVPSISAVYVLRTFGYCGVSEAYSGYFCRSRDLLCGLGLFWGGHSSGVSDMKQKVNKRKRRLKRFFFFFFFFFFFLFFFRRHRFNLRIATTIVNNKWP